VNERLTSLNRQGKREGRTDGDHAIGLDIASVELKDSLGDGQTKPGPFRPPVVGIKPFFWYSSLFAC